jgi:ligand-binding sensor domain-containing protein/signal transduction histidine kinase
VLRLVALLLALPTPGAAATDRMVDRWGVEEGLPNNALTDIIQTRDGYLWVASWARIVRFDGVRFMPIATDLPNVHARALIEHPDGSVWIGASGEGLVRWRPDGARTFTRADGLSGSDVRALAIDDAGRVWAATEGGVSIVDTATVATLGVRDGLPHASVTSVKGGREGWMWIVTATGVCRARASELQCLPRRPGMGPPTAVLEDANGRIWIGTAGTGLIRGDDVPGGACRQGCLAGRDVTTLVEARNGGLWIGLGRSGGVALLGDEGLTQYRAEHGLPAFPVRAIYDDAEGSTWIAIDTAGLVRLRPRRVTAYTRAEGVPAAAVSSMSQDSHGTIWAATRCGPVGRFRGDRFEAQFQEHTREACTHSVLATRDGSLWIGTNSRGLFRWDGRRMHHLGVEDGLSDLEITVLFEDRDGVLWIGSPRGGVQWFGNGRLSRAFGPEDGVATGYISSFAQDPAGRIWIGSNANGLSVYEGGRFTALGAHEGLPTGNISALVVDSRGDLWIGTAAHGLFRRRRGEYDHFGVDQGLGDNLVALIVEDGDDNLWVSTTRGIVRLTRDRIEAVAAGRSPSLQPLTLGRRDGLPHSEGSGGGTDPSGLRARDGRLWFPTIDGVGVVDPRSLPINDRPPPLSVEQVLLSGAPAPVSGAATVHVPAGTATIEVGYAAFSFLDPSRVQFRYRLVGLDDAWEDVGARRVAYFSRLPPATYTFEVIAANNDGVWNTTPAALRLVVAPFWWERTGVRAGAVVLLLVGTGFAVRAVSVRRARARLAELERAHALQRERERIARDLHDELGSRLTRIALLADARHRDDDPSRVVAAARDAVRTMGELVWSVNASAFAQEQTDAAGLQCRLDIGPDLGSWRLGAETRRHLYLAFKEAVNNAVKHGQASRIDVKMDIAGGHFVLAVSDDGRGLLPETPEGTRRDRSSGNGFDNMRGRMRAVGGTLSVESAAGRGTRLTFRLPVP